MLSIDEMLKFYPESMHKYKRQILREYLQCKILEIIFNSKFSDRIVFIGGTAIRIVHGSQRFSEDIDLDSKDLVLSNFTELSEIVAAELELEGY
ncbi:nucleotidyl transferase AbiEii/AbiGii toxin family protein, partial [Candidatus Calescamantes bacterium]|nr:nucleotidyl transferase AbiEii/AbiGii toxin family protein [Candidatus Calescamantes bacterium]